MTADGDAIEVARGAEEIERRRVAQGLLAAGWREPVYFEDYLVEVWRLASVGREDDAR
jgi:hypothetical protein